MVLLLGSFTIGLILALLAFGVLISFRVVGFRDLTVDGSVALGGAVAAVLIVKGYGAAVATAAAFGAGMIAGSITGLLHTRCRINGLLAGILVMTALYSVNLRVMGKSNVSLLTETTLFSWAEQITDNILGTSSFHVWRWDVPPQEVGKIVMMLVLAAVAGVMLHAFFRTNLGLAMRATGDNDQMIRALGVNVGAMTTFGLALSNGFVALSGALLVQYQGFADVQMGIGMVVWGLASMIIGESLVGPGRLGLLITGAIMGSVLFRLLVAIALRGGLNPNDLKLVTAVFVFAALVFPEVLKSLKGRFAAHA